MTFHDILIYWDTPVHNTIIVHYNIIIYVQFNSSQLNLVGYFIDKGEVLTECCKKATISLRNYLHEPIIIIHKNLDYREISM